MNDEHNGDAAEPPEKRQRILLKPLECELQGATWSPHGLCVAHVHECRLRIVLSPATVVSTLSMDGERNGRFVHRTKVTTAQFVEILGNLLIKAIVERKETWDVLIAAHALSTTHSPNYCTPPPFLSVSYSFSAVFGAVVSHHGSQ